MAASGTALGSVRRRKLVSGAHGGFVGGGVFCSGTSFHGGARWLLKVSPYQVSHLRAQPLRSMLCPLGLSPVGS